MFAKKLFTSAVMALSLTLGAASASADTRFDWLTAKYTEYERWPDGNGAYMNSMKLIEENGAAAFQFTPWYGISLYSPMDVRLTDNQLIIDFTEKFSSDRLQYLTLTSNGRREW